MLTPYIDISSECLQARLASIAKGLQWQVTG